jgi:hypothetical protein
MPQVVLLPNGRLSEPKSLSAACGPERFNFPYRLLGFGVQQGKDGQPRHYFSNNLAGACLHLPVVSRNSSLSVRLPTPTRDYFRVRGVFYDRIDFLGSG